MTDSVIAFIGLGSNLGDRRATIESAIKSLERIEGIEIEATSELIETEPIGAVDQDHFLNGALGLRTTLSARALLQECLGIEVEHGRDRTNERRWGPRTLDLDLLLYGEQIIVEPGLHVPHPHLHERGFVLIPLSEIAPLAKHPGLGVTIQELRDRLPISS